MVRKICVKFGDFKSPVRVKLFILPEPNDKPCDLLLLRSMLFQEMLSNSIIIFIADQLILTLPNEGEEEWEINQHIVAAMRAGKLSQHMNAFLLVCAKHLLKTVSLDKRLNQRKSIYKRYAQMIVKQHPCLADNNCEDNYLTVKHKVVRAVGNQIDSKKHGRIRNLKRNQQKASAKRNSGGVSQSDAANSTSGNLSTAVDDDFPDHKSEEELRRKHDFEARREFFKINTKLSLAKLLEKTPYYHDFEKAYDDFLMMYPMSCITEEKNSGKGGQKWPEGAKMDLEVLLAVNALCSTSRGVKGAKPVFVIREVGKNVEPDYSGVNSSAIVFFNGNSLHSMLIIVGSSCNVNYKNINVSSVCQVVLNLLSVYYVTDCNYPAMYGVLSLIDRWCLHQEGFQRQKPVQKDSFSMSAFLKKYDKFVLNDDGDDQHQAQELPSEEDSS
ncbi:hypothetical protein GHT06_020295 [Daphnia sinensis]|uniref:Uncharacterized protein n=1 Tax=Daphnia sinensis TaxID=1820382 RepID=A0AAD5KL83_9CRUS|nr:hypothetical protein GHT06_020295 [Daphnia sinensis]